jgi:hypothetical protein
MFSTPMSSTAAANIFSFFVSPLFDMTGQRKRKIQRAVNNRFKILKTFRSDVAWLFACGFQSDRPRAEVQG